MDTLRYYARAYARDPADKTAQAESRAMRATEPAARHGPDFTRPPAKGLRGARGSKDGRPECRAPARMD
jgi:hypothetical protein